MYIQMLKLKNYKQFRDLEIKFNPFRNVLIGENGAGKTTILEAISHVLGASYYSIEQVGLQSLFNVSVIKEFLSGDKRYEELPNVEIELYIDNNENKFDLVGIHNSKGNNQLSGLKMNILPNDDYSAEIKDILISSEVFPFDYYKVEFRTFSGNSYDSYSRFLRYTSINSTKISTKHATQRFIEEYYKNAKDIEDRTKLQHQFREMSYKFSKETLMSATDSVYQLKLNSNKGKALEENLTIQKKDIDITNFGKGDSMFLNIELALSRTQENVNIILIEEPENHLSYLNMYRLIKQIDQTQDKQVFIATHSNMIATRLELQNAIFLSHGNSMKLDDLAADTSRFFQKSPNNSVLNFILANKVVLVEGDAEYILLDLFYKEYRKREMYEEGIAMISVGGLSFKRYLEIAQHLNKRVAVITDNDADYQKNIEKSYEGISSPLISIFAPRNNDEHTLEVTLYKHNQEFYETKIKTSQMSKGVLEYMLNDKNKAEAAFRTLNVLENEGFKGFSIPPHISEAFKWINS